MELLKRLGGIAGLIIVVAGSAVSKFAPQHIIWGWVLIGAGLVPLIGAIWLNRDDLANATKGRPFRHGANAVFYSLLVLGIVGAVDFLAARHTRRFDLTETGRHSVSQQTIQILERLSGEGMEISFVGFFTPAQEAAKQKAADLIDEYKYHNPHITVKMLDPLRNPAEVRGYGIEEDGTLIVSTKAGEVRITPSRDGALAEENLTNALIKATSKVRKVVCMTTGHGEKTIAESSPEGFQLAADALKKENFDVREVKLLETGAVPEDCSSVVVPGPTHAFLAPESEALDKWLAGGGRLLVLAEPHMPTGLEALLQRYGLKTGNDFIVDVNPMARLLGGSPAAPVVYEYGSHPITKDFQGLATIFPTVESIETVSPTEPGVTTQSLAHTSAQSWGETGAMADRVSFDAATDKGGPLDLAASAVRKLEGAPASAPADSNAPAPDAGEPGGREARLVLFGDSDFAGNNGLMMAGNRDLFLNAVAWLNERSDLISVRPRPRTGQPLILTGVQGRLTTFYSLALFPLLLGLAGFGVYLRRRRL